MDTPKNIMIFYIVSAALVIGGFILLFLAKNVLLLGTGIIVIIGGLILFLIGRENAPKRGRR